MHAAHVIPNVVWFLIEKVAYFKQLRGGIEFREEVPKSASGKILRRILKDEYRERTKAKL